MVTISITQSISNGEVAISVGDSWVIKPEYVAPGRSPRENILKIECIDVEGTDEVVPIIHTEDYIGCPGIVSVDTLIEMYTKDDDAAV